MKRAGILALGIFLLPLAASAGPPSIILLGGRVFTNDPAKPAAEAIAIEGDKIVAVGTDAEIQGLGGANTVRFRLNGATVIPGINDAHAHPGRGPVGLQIGTSPESTAADLVLALGSAIEETSPELWLIGEVGRPIMLDESVNRAKLDQLAPNRKVLLRSFTGHGTILSSRAIQEIGLAENTPDPPGGRFGRNANGTLNGRVFEYAEYAVNRKIAQLTQQPGDLKNALQDYVDEAIRFGITSVQAMPISEDNAAFAAALAEINPPLRIRNIFFPLSLPLLPREQFVPKGTNGIKWILDGTPVEKGAAVRTPYPDGGGTGQLNFTSLTGLIKSGLGANQQLLFHAAGDHTAATLIKEMENTPGVNWPSKRLRIEHGDGLLPDLDARARDLGIVVVLNPSHFFARSLYPAGGYMRAKSLLAVPLKVAIGSDGPLNPYLNIMMAVSRADGNRREELTREEAVAAYTLGSAFAENRDDKGMIAKNKLADIAVLSQNIFSVPLDQLPLTFSKLTIIGGKVVHNVLP